MLAKFKSKTNEGHLARYRMMIKDGVFYIEKRIFTDQDLSNEKDGWHTLRKFMGKYYSQQIMGIKDDSFLTVFKGFTELKECEKVVESE